MNIPTPLTSVALPASWVFRELTYLWKVIVCVFWCSVGGCITRRPVDGVQVRLNSMKSRGIYYLSIIRQQEARKSQGHFLVVRAN